MMEDMQDKSIAEDASITSEDKKMFDGPDLSDIESLIIDFDEDDLEFPRPSSPLLLGSNFAKSKNNQSSQNTNEGTDGKDCKDGDFCTFSDILDSPTKESTHNVGNSEKKFSGNSEQPATSRIVGLSKPSDPEIDMTESEQSSPRKKKIKLRARAACVSPVYPPGESPKSGFSGQRSMLDSPSFSVQLGFSKKRHAADSSNDENVTSEECMTPKIPRLDGDAYDQSKNPYPDDDVISLYAGDEDYVSLYNNPESCTTRQVKMDVPSVRDNVVKSNAVQEPPSRKVVIQPKPIAHRSGACAGKRANLGFKHGIDLRSSIPSMPYSNIQEASICKIRQLLNENTRSQTLFAAVTFCKAYMDHQIKYVSHEFRLLTRKLADMLYHYGEMKHLYRIVRLAIDMQIILSDDVLVGLIDHLGWSFEADKITVILNQIKEKAVPTGSKVYNAAHKHLTEAKKHSPGSEILATQIENSPTKILGPTMMNKEKPVPVQRSIVPNLVSCGPEKEFSFGARSIVRSTGHSGSINLHAKEPIYIEISNSSGEQSFRERGFSGRFVTFDKDKKKDEPRTGAFDFLKTEFAKPRISSNTTQCVGAQLNADLLGKSVLHLIEAVGTSHSHGSMCVALADLIIGGRKNSEGDICPTFASFLKSVLECQSSSVDNESVRTWLTWVGNEIMRRLSRKNVYTMGQVMTSMGLQLLPPLTTGQDAQAKRRERYQIANNIIMACLDENDLTMALKLLDEYFSTENPSDAGPVLAPMLCQTLCAIATVARNHEKYVDAAKCLSLLPAGLGDGTELPLMEQVLEGFVSASKQHSPEEEKICNEMVEQMLARCMVSRVRQIIIKAFCANVLPIFKYLEAKGVYRRPQIADHPHLVILPYVLSIEEMALILQRHLTELSQFLMEMRQKIRNDIPMRILICKNVGSLECLTPDEAGSYREAYQSGLRRLNVALRSVLNPSLGILNRSIHPGRKEITINVNVGSVRLWMLANTKYDERAILGAPRAAERQDPIPVSPALGRPRSLSPALPPLRQLPGTVSLLPPPPIRRNMRLMI